MADLEKALALHRAGRLVESAQMYRRLIRRRPNDHAALHWLGVLHAQEGDFQKAREILQRAIAIAPGQAMYRANLGMTLKKLGLYRESVDCYKQALTFDPENPELWNGLGSVLLAAGEADQALQWFERALTKSPAAIDPLINRGIAQQALGRMGEAIETFRLAAHSNPTDAYAHSNLGLALVIEGRIAEAKAVLERARDLDVNNASIHNNLGLAYLKDGQLGKAQQAFVVAVELEPQYADAHANLGTVLQKLGDFDAAIHRFSEAISLAGELPHLATNLGNALRAAGRTKDSITTLRRAVARNPDSAIALVALGLSLMIKGDIEEAIGNLKEALRLDPGSSSAHNNLGMCFLSLGQAPSAVDSFRHAVRLDHRNMTARSNLLFALNYLPNVTRTELFEEHTAFAETFERALKAGWPNHANSRDPDRRLRIGYVSGDFYEHAVAFFFEPVLALHDKAKFELFCFYAGTREDAVTTRLRQQADHWHSIAHTSDEAAFGLIQRLGIDILVDLSGHTTGNRLGLFMRKPAPVQAHWLGYLTTTGLQSIDYRITDERADPVGEGTSYYTEECVRLPSTWAFQGAEEANLYPSPLPSLKSATFTFGCFNAPAKLTDEVLECWSRVLIRVPNSTLLLGNAGHRALVTRVTEVFERCGVPSSRILFAPRLSLHDFLRLHQKVDLALDPYPYNGGATSCHALWMGVPFVTLRGDRYMSRIGADMLQQLGIEEFIADSQETYVETAVCWAQRRSELDTIRRSLRSRLQESTLGDTHAFVRALESAYREIWQRWCSKPVTGA